MADQGRPLPEPLIRTIRRMRASGFPLRHIAWTLGVDKKTVIKYLRNHPPRNDDGDDSQPPEFRS